METRNNAGGRTNMNANGASTANTRTNINANGMNGNGGVNGNGKNLLIKMEKVVKRYGNVLALDHFDFGLNKGEIVGLLGPNGSGKTTAINCILSLLKYDSGTIEVFGQRMRPDAYDLKRKIGVVPQEIAVFPSLTVWENVDYFCGLYIADKNQRRICVDEAIEFTGLEDYHKRPAGKLSGGLRRRLNVACGIAHRPELLFLDEPTVAVDAQSRNFMLEGFRSLNEQGTSIVYTSHYLEEVDFLCDRIIIMDQGRNLAAGTSAELKDMISLSERIQLSVPQPPEDFSDMLHRLPNLASIEESQDGYELRFDGGRHNLSNVLELLKAENIPYEKLFGEQPTLNDVFLELTGKELRD